MTEDHRDEYDLLLAIYDGDRCPYDAIREEKFNYFKALKFLKQLKAAGMYEAPVALELGWLTPKGEKFAERLQEE